MVTETEPLASPRVAPRARPSSFDPAVAGAFGRVARRIRIAEGIAQDALAYKATIDRSYYGKLERGERQPSLSFFLRIAAALRLSASALIVAVEKEIAAPWVRPRSPLRADPAFTPPVISGRASFDAYPVSSPTWVEFPMNRLSAVLDGGPPAVAVSFENVGDVDAGILASQAVASGADIAELRIDRFPERTPAVVVDYAMSFGAMPTIATIRSAREGGSWDGSEHERLALFRAVLPSVDGVDVELSSGDVTREVVNLARSAGKVSIASYHNFENTPEIDRLDELLRDALSLGADYVKISAMATSLSDVQRLTEFLLRHRSRPLIVIAMGALGTLSRIFFPALGSRMTFSSIGAAVAPGQMSFEETLYMLRKFYPSYNDKKIVDLDLLEDV